MFVCLSVCRFEISETAATIFLKIGTSDPNIEIPCNKYYEKGLLSGRISQFQYNMENLISWIISSLQACLKNFFFGGYRNGHITLPHYQIFYTFKNNSTIISE